jgi:hypothetical protein
VCRHSVLPGLGGLALRGDGELVGVVLGQVRKGVVQVLRRGAHRHRGGVDETLGDEARVEVHLVAHRVVPHVLDAARQDDVRGAEGDLAGAGGDRGQCSGAHPVDREPGDGLRQASEERDVAAEGEALIAHLCRRGDDHVADPLRREPRLAAQQLAHELDDHVVGARAPEHAVLARPPEGGADAVDQDDLTEFTPHGARIVLTRLIAGRYWPAQP